MYNFRKNIQDYEKINTEYAFFADSKPARELVEFQDYLKM